MSLHTHSHRSGGRAGHAHAPASAPRERAKERRGLLLALVTTGLILVAELVGGWLSNSLALLADAGHMLSDALALALAAAAVTFAARPPTPSKTYGWYRLEILAALVNGVALVVISLFILWEAYERLADPPEVQTGLMMSVALVGLLANGLGLFFLSGHGHSLNMRGAYLHVLGDLLSSVAVVLGGLAMWLTGAFWVDPALSALIALIIVASAWRLLRESVDVLMESVPPGLSQQEIATAICEIEGVTGVHDLHVWSLTSGMAALSCHVEVAPDRVSELEALLDAVRFCLRERFGIDHTTIQIEPDDYKSRQAIHWHLAEEQNG